MCKQQLEIGESARRGTSIITCIERVHSLAVCYVIENDKNIALPADENVHSDFEVNGRAGADQPLLPSVTGLDILMGEGAE